MASPTAAAAEEEKMFKIYLKTVINTNKYDF